VTPTELADYFETVRARIVSLIATELVPEEATEGERIPKIIDDLIVERNRDQWAARLRSNRHIEVTSGVEQKMVHAFMVGDGGLETYPDNTIRSVSYKLRCTVDSYYQDSPGSDGDSPAKRHAREIARVAHVLLTTRPFGVTGVKKVVGFRERRGLAMLGNVQVRESLGEMFIELNPIQI
jgi:hypothetical protein